MYSVSELLEAIQELSPSEMNLLSKAIQKRFSVTVEEEKGEYNFWQYHYLGGGYSVVLNEAGPNKVRVIKVLHDYLGLCLRECKELVEHRLPAFVKENCKKDEAYEIRDELEAVGAVVSLEDGYVYDPLPYGYLYD